MHLIYKSQGFRIFFYEKLKTKNSPKFIHMKTNLVCANYTKTCMMMFFLVLILSVFSFCKKEKTEVKNGFKYAIPIKYSDGLETASLKSVGIDSVIISNMMDYINSTNGHTLHNILILRNNKFVFEEYFKGYKISYSAANLNGDLIDYNKSIDHPMQSVSKSVTSLIVGIAVREGYITDLNKKIIDYFPQYADILVGQKANITIHHLLTMTCGLAIDESTYSYNDSRNELRQAITSDDPLSYILSKPIVATPGTVFHYSSGSGILLAAIIEKVTGMKFLDYANKTLFDPLRSEGGLWSACHNGLIFASGGLYFKARELSKIGLLFLNKGVWEGQQIISPDWISASFKDYVSTTANFFPNTSYGYQWWITSFVIKGISHKCFFAAGWGDQFMFIIPDFDLIVEFNSGNYQGTSVISPLDLMNNYILKSIN